MAGAVTALGDTLFPSASLAEGLVQDFSSTSALLVRLRVWHPVLAVGVGLYLFYLANSLRSNFQDGTVRRYSLGLMILFGIQLGAGAINLLLLAPVWMQIVHLWLATLVWICLTLVYAAVLSGKAETELAGGKIG